MLDALTGFLEELRRAGLKASPAEALDAARALTAVGVESRERVRLGLRLALAKDLREQTLFDLAFDGFFAGPAAVPGRGRKAARGVRGGDGSGRNGSGRGRGRPPAGAAGAAAATPPRTRPLAPKHPRCSRSPHTAARAPGRRPARRSC